MIVPLAQTSPPILTLKPQATPAAFGQRSLAVVERQALPATRETGFVAGADKAGRYVRAVWARFLTWRMRRATRIVLDSLSDRTLADIGVRRGEIESIVRDIEWRKLRWNIPV